jgi:hypothetical protein
VLTKTRRWHSHKVRVANEIMIVNQEEFGKSSSGPPLLASPDRRGRLTLEHNFPHGHRSSFSLDQLLLTKAAGARKVSAHWRWPGGADTVNKIAVVGLSLCLLHAPAAAAELTAAQKSAICGARPTCTFGKTYDGGRSSSGAVLSVIEVHLGLKDKPDDAPDDGCLADDDKRDGGVEYWLLAGNAQPGRLLKLCNDGYGASGIGEDKVTVGPNRLVHLQVGGSAWRWETTVTYTLAPWRAVGEQDCSFNDLSADNGTVTDIDYVAMRARSIAKDAADQGEGVGCPQWPAGALQHFTPEPAPGLLGAYDILVPSLGGSDAPAKIPAGTTIGDCGAAMTSAGVNGFVVFGNPAPSGNAAELRVVALSPNSLLIQVFDPLAEASGRAPPRSWIDLPHAEIWSGHDAESHTRPPLSKVSQIAVDLNGNVHVGVGLKDAAPAIERWQARDGNNRPVVVMLLKWADDTQFLGGAAIVYSQAEHGRQTRLVANTGIVNNRPLYLPDIVSLPNGTIEPPPGKCRIQDGRLSLESAN